MLQAQLQAMEAEREQQRQRLAALEAERELERQRLAALEAKQEQDQRQMAEVLSYVRGLAMTQGGTVPQFLLGQLQATPPPQLDSTPVSMTNILVSLNVKPSET